MIQLQSMYNADVIEIGSFRTIFELLTESFIFDDSNWITISESYNISQKFVYWKQPFYEFSSSAECRSRCEHLLNLIETMRIKHLSIQ